MASEQLQTIHPRRAGLGAALERAFPLPETQEEAERKLVRRIEIRERMR